MQGSRSQSKAPSSAQRVLRVGVVVDGKVLQEKLLRDTGAVTLGSDAGCTLRVPDDGLSGRRRLFQVTRRGVRLCASAVDAGVLREDGTLQDLADVDHDLPLNPDGQVRGRLQMGDDTVVLFHFVNAPPAATKPLLPSSVKGGWVKRAEPIFTSVLAGSFMVHAMMSILVFSVEPPPPMSQGQLQDELRGFYERTKRPVVPAAPPVKTPSPKTATKTEPKVKAKTQTPQPPPKTEQSKPASTSPASASKRRQVRGQVAGKGLLQVIGSGVGGDGIGAVFSSGTALSDDLTAALAGSGGVDVRPSSDTQVKRRGESSTTGPADLVPQQWQTASPPPEVERKAKQRVKVKVRAEVAENIKVEDGTIDTRAVRKRLRRRQAAFQACYEAALKLQRGLAGKLVVDFTIGERGRVVDVDVVRDDLAGSNVARCVTKALARVVFPPAAEGEVTLSNTFVFQPK